MIDWWEIIEDPISESAQSSGTTRIEVHCVPEPGEEIAATIARAIDETYSYRSDPLGYHCIPNLPHPRNNQRLAAGFRPVFLNTFSAKENTENPYLVMLDLGWAVPEQIQGGLELERMPPRRGQWSDRRQIIADPNTGYLLTTNAGEIYRGIEKEVVFGTLEYSYRHPTLPDWFVEAQGAPINEDTVRLGGRTYQPRTLRLPLCSSNPLRVREGEYWEEISLALHHKPDGWDEEYPHIGNYERRFAYVLNNGKTCKDLYHYGHIKTQADLEYYAKLADTRARIDGVPLLNGFRVVSTYAPILNTITLDADGRGMKEVERPVMLYPCGAAIRDWDNPTLPIKAPLDPQDFNSKRFTTEKLMRFSQFGLW